MKRNQTLFWAFSSSMAGFLFGFDTAVISGAEQNIQSVWALNDVVLGQMVAMALYGTIIGALAGGIPAQRFGLVRARLHGCKPPLRIIDYSRTKANPIVRA